MIELKRKCSYCKDFFYINRKNINNAIYYGKASYHSKCFIDMCNKKKENKRADIAKKWSDTLENINEIKEESYLFYDSMITKEEIFVFIQENYNITVVPTRIWHKLGDIYSGAYKGMLVGIPPSHLIDMWKKKMDMLNKLYRKNSITGKKMTTEQRLSYDLSVLINKYDSYLKWLDKQKILEAEKQEVEDNIVTSNFIKNIQANTDVVDTEKESNDISDLVDDIFGDD